MSFPWCGFVFPCVLTFYWEEMLTWGLFSFPFLVHSAPADGRAERAARPFSSQVRHSAWLLVHHTVFQESKPSVYICVCTAVLGALPCLITRGRRTTSSPSLRVTSSPFWSWLGRNGHGARSTGELEYFPWTSQRLWSRSHHRCHRQ